MEEDGGVVEVRSRAKEDLEKRAIVMVVGVRRRRYFVCTVSVESGYKYNPSELQI